MAIIYTYPEINQVEGEDLLLISDTDLYKRPTRSVTVDNLAAYIGTVVGVVQNLQSVLTVGNTYVSPDGYGTFTLNDITSSNGNIKYANTDEGWGYALNAEEGLYFTDGNGSFDNGKSSFSPYAMWIGNGTHQAQISSNNLTASRIFQFPNTAGTIALTSDIPAPGPSGSGTANYTARWIDTDTLGIGALYDNGNNVGIGTTSPSEKLEVAGNIVVNGSNDSADGLHLKDRTFVAFSDAGSVVSRFRSSAAGVFQFQDGSYNTNIVLNSNGSSYLNGGNVGIGTTSPSDKLHVSAGAIRLDNFYQLRWGGTGTGIYGHSSQGLNFYTDSGTTRLKIENSGNVGIGTTNPTDRLEVYGGNLIVNDGTSKSRLRPSDLYMQQAGVIKAWLRADGNSYLNGGNVGIGTTSPAQKLTVLGVGSFGTSTSQTLVDYDGLNAVGNTDYIRFKVDNSEKLRIKSNGNVGIGTTSPTTKLHVNGDIRIQGENELYFGGTGSVPNWEITASGSDLLVNDTGTNVGSVLFNNDEGVALPRLTTTEINAISSPAQGLMAYNTTLNTICFYNGSSWQKVSHTNM